MRKLALVTAMATSLLSLLGGATVGAASSETSCSNYVADPGGSGCTWTAGNHNFGAPATSSLVSLAPGVWTGGSTLGAHSSAAADGSARLRSGTGAQSRASAVWNHMTIPVPALTTPDGSIHLTSELASTLRASGSATDIAVLSVQHVEADDCNHLARLPIPVGTAVVRLSLTIAPNDCPSLFRTHPGNLQIAFELSSSTWNRMSSFDLASQLRSVDVFFAQPSDAPVGNGAEGAPVA